MSGHADTIRHALQAGLLRAGGWDPAFRRALDALNRLEAEFVKQADHIAWLEGEVAGWRIKLAAAVTENQHRLVENQQLREALEALNALRSNIIATQSATWSNSVYPLVAILNSAGFKVDLDRTDEQKQEHLNAYGGAGSYPVARAALDGTPSEDA